MLTKDPKASGREDLRLYQGRRAAPVGRPWRGWGLSPWPQELG